MSEQAFTSKHRVSRFEPVWIPDTDQEEQVDITTHVGQEVLEIMPSSWNNHPLEWGGREHRLDQCGEPEWCLHEIPDDCVLDVEASETPIAHSDRVMFIRDGVEDRAFQLSGVFKSWCENKGIDFEACPPFAVVLSDDFLSRASEEYGVSVGGGFVDGIHLYRGEDGEDVYFDTFCALPSDYDPEEGTVFAHEATHWTQSILRPELVANYHDQGNVTGTRRMGRIASVAGVATFAGIFAESIAQGDDHLSILEAAGATAGSISVILGSLAERQPVLILHMLDKKEREARKTERQYKDSDFITVDLTAEA